MGDNTEIDFTRGAPIAGAREPSWIHGSPPGARDTNPPAQTHEHDEHTLIFRQNKAEHFKAPFMFLLFGNERALLLDTGAATRRDESSAHWTSGLVEMLVAVWLRNHPRGHYELVVAHTDGHRDHHAGDALFAGIPHARVVPASVDGVRDFFGFRDWPWDVVQFDLGGRVLEVIGSPGHHEASLALYDPWTGFLLTGDTAFPGRIHVDDQAAFADSLQRLVRFARRHPVTGILGSHIDMTRAPGRAYPPGCKYQPDEHPLRLTVDQLAAISDAVFTAGRPGTYVYDDFIIQHGADRRSTPRRLGGSLPGKIADLFGRSG